MLSPAPCPHSSLSFPPTQGTHCPKGKRCQTIGQTGRPPGTGLCVSDHRGRYRQCLLLTFCYSVWGLFVLPSPPEALLSEKRGSVGNGAPQGRPHPSFLQQRSLREGGVLGDVGTEGWRKRASVFIAEGSSSRLQGWGGEWRRNGPRGALSLESWR